MAKAVSFIPCTGGFFDSDDLLLALHWFFALYHGYMGNKNAPGAAAHHTEKL